MTDTDRDAAIQPTSERDAIEQRVVRRLLAEALTEPRHQCPLCEVVRSVVDPLIVQAHADGKAEGIAEERDATAQAIETSGRFPGNWRAVVTRKD
jgi:hypothetical protein